MQKAIMSIVYHSGTGHTRQLAELLSSELRTADTTVHVLTVEEAKTNFDLLNESDTIIFGCPTYFGNVSAGFKNFMEATGSFWYKQCWKDKLAAGFTTSSTTNGDKLNTLTSLVLFAAQHGMCWISLGILPRFINNEQTDGQNRMASYIGLMAQCDNSLDKVHPIHTGDQLTVELFASRIINVTQLFKNKNQLNQR